MCLALPGKIITIQESSELPTGEVDFSGVKKQVCFVYTPEAKIGDYVIVHVGFSLSILDEKEALITLQLFDKGKS